MMGVVMGTGSQRRIALDFAEECPQLGTVRYPSFGFQPCAQFLSARIPFQ
jgi:hypothetical protein